MKLDPETSLFDEDTQTPLEALLGCNEPVRWWPWVEAGVQALGLALVVAAVFAIPYFFMLP